MSKKDSKQLLPDELLSEACWQDRQNIVQLLMESSAHVTNRSKVGNTHLHKACIFQRSETECRLFSHLHQHHRNFTFTTHMPVDIAVINNSVLKLGMCQYWSPAQPPLATRRRSPRADNATSEKSKWPNNEVHRAIHEKLKSLNKYPDEVCTCACTFCDLLTATAKASGSHACFDSPGTPALSFFRFEVHSHGIIKMAYFRPCENNNV